MTQQKQHPYVEEWNWSLALNKHYFKMDQRPWCQPRTFETATGRNRNTSRCNESSKFFEIHAHWPVWLSNQKTRDNRCRQGCGGRGTLIQCWGLNYCSLCGNQYGVFLKLLNWTQQRYDPAVPVLGSYLQKF